MMVIVMAVADDREVEKGQRIYGPAVRVYYYS
jgi:hypothetical protein